jgi:hypothetical protein
MIFSQKVKNILNCKRHLKISVNLKDVEWTPITFTKRKLEPGGRDETVPFILERLLTLDLIDTSRLSNNRTGSV